MSAIVARQPGALSLSARRGQSVVGSGCGRLVRQTATTAAAPRCLSARAPRVTTSTALLTPHPPALLSALLPSRSPSFPLLPVVLSSRFSNLVLERHELATHFFGSRGTPARPLGAWAAMSKKAGAAATPAAGGAALACGNAECGKVLAPPLPQCSKCKAEAYCCKACQIAAWKAVPRFGLLCSCMSCTFPRAPAPPRGTRE